jgi:ribosomal protein S18 acetylase RimI-like enzyme
MEDQIQIRPLREDDLAVLFGDFTRPHGVAWLERQARDEVFVAVAELNGVPVARIGVDFTLYSGVSYLWSAHVEGEYQNRGIGTTLIGYLEQVAREHGFTVMRIDVGKDNPRAQKLYERLGYMVYGDAIGRWSYHDGTKEVEVVDDNWTMRKELVSTSS